ncbi:hypothetical protein ID866_12139 [Astraeus odoratus]|nr:hypothetical protein ID866_12139 [Astraeus odoratus]
MVQEVSALHKKLNNTEDDDEKRALEEDITGKILWIMYYGIRAEVKQVLDKAS